MISEEKQRLRQEMRQRVVALGDDVRAEESRSICARLQALPVWRSARRVAVYYPLPSEPDIRPVLVEGGKQWCFPCWTKPLMTFHACRLEDLIPGPGSLPSPPEDFRVIAPEDLDLILVPGLAFDEGGGRLGRGGGFYDRFLKAVKAPSIGLSFSVQKVDRVPREAFDIPLSQILFGV